MPTYNLLSFDSPDALARAAATAWVDDIAQARSAGKHYSVALSGGRFVQTFFALTVELARARSVSFDHVHFFWADERCVPPESPDSNFKIAQDSLFAPLNIPATNIHRLRGELDPEVAARQAITELAQIVPPGASGLPAFDLVQLGMGEDGHIASLFPNASPEIINCSASYLAVYDSPKPPPRRLSLSYAAIATARQVSVLVSGASKAEALAESLLPTGKTPLARLLQNKPRLTIFCHLPKINT